MSVTDLETRDGVAIISIDNPPVNALSQAVRAGLVERLEAALADDGVAAIVLACRGRTFIAGADIREFGQPPQPPHLPDVVLALDAAHKPVVAALHGTALGGGLEIAMGCHYRVAAAGARLGLPEVTLGLLPGAGGTQLLPRLIGAEAALDMMLDGKPVTAEAAAKAGLVDEVCADDALLAAAIACAGRVAAAPPRRTSERDRPAAGDDLFAARRATLARRARGLLSPGKIVDCVEAATRGTLAEGLTLEREAFLECRASPQSAGLRHAFFAERSAAKVPGLDSGTTERALARVTVIGAGTMGAGIGYACLAAGLAVDLLDKDAEGAARGAATVGGLIDGGLARGKLDADGAAAMRARFSAGTEFAVAAEADLVIEAVFENLALKKDVFAELGRVCRDGAVLASNTSTLDIDAIAAASGRAADVVGLHFFSPAHVMRLLEIVRGRETADDVIATALALAKRLGKVGVVVGNCYGFVGNRMLYGYGRENQLLLLEGAAPEYVDEVLVDWGMAMGPNAVGDLAGLDVGYKARRERGDLPDDPRFYRVADLLVEQGRLGQKTGRGTFLYEDGSRTPRPDPAVRELIAAEAKRLGIEQREIPADEIVGRCIYALVTEGARILEDGIAARSSDIDVIWLNGYGFPRHRGGPMHYADSVGPGRVLETVRDYRERFGARYWEPPALLERLAASGGRFADAGD